jgi:hypothetical protein
MSESSDDDALGVTAAAAGPSAPAPVRSADVFRTGVVLGERYRGRPEDLVLPLRRAASSRTAQNAAVGW